MKRHTNDDGRDDSTPRKRIFASVGAALLVVLATIIGASALLATPVAATHDCDGVDMFIASVGAGADYVASPGDPIDTVYYEKCGLNHQAQVVNEMKENDADQEWTDIYTASAATYENQRQSWVTRTNLAENQDVIVWGRGQAEAIMAWRDNGANQSGMETAFSNYTEAYWAQQQRMVLENAETQMASLQYERNAAVMEDNVTANDTYRYGQVQSDRTVIDTYGSDSSNAHDFQVDGDAAMVNVTYTLTDGSTKTIEVITSRNANDDLVIWSPAPKEYVTSVGADAGNESNYVFITNYRDTYSSSSGSWDRDNSGDAWVAMPSPEDDNMSATPAYDPSLFAESYTLMQDINDQQADNIPPTTKSLYEGLENGTIKPDEAIPALTQIDYYTNRSADGNHFVYTTAILANGGMETPSLNSTGHMWVEYQGTEYKGFLMTHDSPENGWQVNQTYNTSDFDGTEIIVSTDGQSITLDENSEFTITKITDENGNEKNSTTTQQYSQKTYNNTEFTQTVDEMQELRELIEQREPDGAGGAGGGLGGVSPLQAAGVLAILVGVAYILYRNEDDEPPYGGAR